MSKALLAILCVLSFLIVGDAVSTYLCLTIPTPEGIDVWEYNPVAEWTFRHLGLVPGLLTSLLVKALGLIFIWKWAHQSRGRMLFYLTFMCGAVLLTAYANFNNWYIYYRLVIVEPWSVELLRSFWLVYAP